MTQLWGADLTGGRYRAFAGGYRQPHRRAVATAAGASRDGRHADLGGTDSMGVTPMLSGPASVSGESISARSGIGEPQRRSIPVRDPL
jgi:hypothetical protein